MGRGKGSRRNPMKKKRAAATPAEAYHYVANRPLPENLNHELAAEVTPLPPQFVPASRFPCYSCRENHDELALLLLHNGMAHSTDNFGCGFCSNRFPILLSKIIHRGEIHGIGVGVGIH